MPFVPAWSTCPCINAPKACQLLIFTCQRTNKHTKVPTGQRQANVSNWRANVPSRVTFSTWRTNLQKSVLLFQLPLRKGVLIFQLFFERIIFFYIPYVFITSIFYIFCILNVYLIYIFYMNILPYLTLYAECKKPI